MLLKKMIVAFAAALFAAALCTSCSCSTLSVDSDSSAENSGLWEDLNDAEASGQASSADDSSGSDGESSGSSGGDGSKTADEDRNAEAGSGEKGSVENPKGSESSEEGAFEWYESLSPEAQQEYFESFDDPADFFRWYDAAKADYDSRNEGIAVEGPYVDLGKYVD